MLEQVVKTANLRFAAVDKYSNVRGYFSNAKCAMRTARFYSERSSGYFVLDRKFNSVILEKDLK